MSHICLLHLTKIYQIIPFSRLHIPNISSIRVLEVLLIYFFDNLGSFWFIIVPGRVVIILPVPYCGFVLFCWWFPFGRCPSFWSRLLFRPCFLGRASFFVVAFLLALGTFLRFSSRGLEVVCFFLFLVGAAFLSVDADLFRFLVGEVRVVFVFLAGFVVALFFCRLFALFAFGRFFLFPVCFGG